MALPPSPTTTPLLLDLPDPCLLAVLRCCADDPAALFSAARAHSRLHQAAVLALSRVAVHNSTQQQLDGLVQYLCRQGQHVSSISLEGVVGQQLYLSELLNTTQLHRLQLYRVRLWLHPQDGVVPGVLALAGSMPLTQLRLSDCTLLDGPEGLAAALALLPGLEQLSVCHVRDSPWHMHSLCLPTAAIQQLQQLTYLELDGVILGNAAVGVKLLPSLRALTRLVDLRLLPEGHNYEMEGDWLSGCRHLTRLVLSAWGLVVHPGVLAGRTQLQHLEVRRVRISCGSAGAAQLLSELQTLQQLTHLSLSTSLTSPGPSNLPLAAYSALTASSRLQHLDISGCFLPAGVWQHIFPAGRQLPHLTSLDVERVGAATHFAAAPPGTLLSSCCPGLQSLNIMRLLCSTEQLAPLQGLSSLHTLFIGPPSCQGLEVVYQLTSLRQLTCEAPGAGADGLLLQLTCLQHLTCLDYEGQVDGELKHLVLKATAVGDQPVWRQVLQHHIGHSNPEVAQHVAAALGVQIE